MCCGQREVELVGPPSWTLPCLSYSAGLWALPSYGYAPTKLNVADDPTRLQDLRPPYRHRLHELLSLPAFYSLGQLRLRRPLASWARLFLVAAYAFDFATSLDGWLAGRLGTSPRLSVRHDLFPFDSTRGFPGEGPYAATFLLGPGLGLLLVIHPLVWGVFLLGRACKCPLDRSAFTSEFLVLAPSKNFGTFAFCLTACNGHLGPPCAWPGLEMRPWPAAAPVTHSSSAGLPGAASSWIPLQGPAFGPLRDFDSSLGFPGEGWFLFRVFRAFGGFWFLASRAAMASPAPRAPAELERAARRQTSNLVADRVVRPATRGNREKLLSEFDNWLSFSGKGSLQELVALPFDQAETIAANLVAYGQYLFRSGLPYYKYSETINGLATLSPGIRRSLTYAWDLAFAWLSEEPPVHHAALPKGILLALLAASLFWGWLNEAGVFGLAWCGLLRIGEVLQAKRRDLILPADAAPGTNFALLQVRSPKTRGRAARHQAVRIDPADIIQLLDLAFGRLPPEAPLWPMSSGTLRRRLRLLLDRLGLVDNGKPAFDLASFRPGGATWMLQLTENSELVRRRGRWLSLRVMEVYLQEVVATTFLPKQPEPTRALIAALADDFGAALRKAIFMHKNAIPP